ncbi:MAG: diaminopimelate epimerase [Gemmatimonadaceae bacterium]|nr:diaminopimelate epimerase [Acetobacteraceae bacterium]
MIPFVKAHGAGNDFIIIDERARPLDLAAAAVRALSDRRTGIGCDQFITLHAPPPHTDADLVMRIRNPDGSEAGACGNATRCVAELLFEENGRPYQVIRTVAGDLPAVRMADGRQRIDMGAPRLDWAEVPLAHAMDTLHLPLPGDPAACSMGNPHATLFVPNLDAAAIAADGAALERDPLFPDRANIGFVQVMAPDRIRLRVWERGAGLTLACGSGACAAVVNAHRRGLIGRRATVLVDGGVLDIEWTAAGRVLMAGPAATSFRGTVAL